MTGSHEVRGSIPLISTKRVLDEHLLFQRWIRREGVTLIPNRNRRLRLTSKAAVFTFVHCKHSSNNNSYTNVSEGTEILTGFYLCSFGRYLPCNGCLLPRLKQL